MFIWTNLVKGEMSNEEEEDDPPPLPTHPCHNVYKGMEQVSNAHLDNLGQVVNIIFVC